MILKQVLLIVKVLSILTWVFNEGVDVSGNYTNFVANLKAVFLFLFKRVYLVIK